MKLDTSSYYPQSHLDDDDMDEVSTEITGEEITGDEASAESVPAAEEPQDSGYENEPDRSVPPTNMEKFLDRVATFLSWALVPLLMPVYGVLLAFNVSILNFTTFPVKLTFVLITAAFTLGIPMLLVLLLKRVGLVNDLGLNGRKERLIPYIISFVSMAGTGVFMWYKGAPLWLVMFFGGGAVAAIVNLIVNFRWKISAHAAGIAGVVALMVRIMRDGFPQEDAFTWLLISILLSGLMGSARIWLGRHTVWQVVAGFAVGFTSVILMTSIGL
ncbi:MAG: phosphatase PAP2 family protein [Muribaculaceae bacterium]|nr:phosphatase PAP2 family protein [Muribaculaceae bacterium]